MMNYDVVAWTKHKKSNSKWTKMPDQPYKILITGGSGR